MGVNVFPRELEEARLGWNVGFSALSFGLRIGVNIVLIVIAGRVLPTQEFGQYTLAISLGSIFVIPIDFGFNFLITREVAKDVRSATYYLRNGALAKAWLGGIGFLLLAVTLYVLQSSEVVVAASLVMMSSFVANSYGAYFNSIFKGLQRFEYEALTNGILYAVILITQLSVLWLAPSPVNLALCFLAGRLVFVCVGVGLYRRAVPVGWGRPRLNQAWRIVVRSSPFALYTFSAVLSVQLGTVILSYFGGETAAGEFQKALRFGMALTIPLVICEDVFYAYLSKLGRDSWERFSESVVVLNKIAAALLMPVVSATVLYGHELSRGAYGPKTTSMVGDSVMIVIGAYLCLYLLLVSPTLMSIGREDVNLAIWVSGGLLNVVANLVLIPRHGVMGASYAMLITYGTMKLMFIAYAWHLRLRVADWELVLRFLVPQVAVLILVRAAGLSVGPGLAAVAAVAFLCSWSLLSGLVRLAALSGKWR